MNRWKKWQIAMSLLSTVLGILSLAYAKEGFGVALGSLKPADVLYATKIRQACILCFWIIAPPLWFWFEYFFLYRPIAVAARPPIEEYKHGVDVSSKIWLALVTALLGLYFGKDFAH